jgi:hypothetical protein
MGLSHFFLAELVDLKSRGEMERADTVLEIGAQQLSDLFLQQRDDIATLYALFERPAVDLGSPVGAAGGSITKASPSSRRFWESLGISYACIEYAGQDGSLALDLNRDDAPVALRNRFDLIVNAGTTEHVVNQENAFRLIHDMTTPGGLMIHEVPCSGMLNHGFVKYTPNFFFRLCKFNDYFPVSIKTRTFRRSQVPADVRASNIQFGGGIDPIDVDEVTDFLIYAALRKQHDTPFMTPLDYPLGG